jgi:hypothetical protein
MMIELDEAALEHILEFICVPQPRLCCKAWAAHIYKSLQLEYRIQIHKLLHEQNPILYHHCAVRSMGSDFEECVAFQFEFYPEKYHLQWSRSFDAWSADNERQVGEWQVVGSNVRCISKAGPQTTEGQVRFAQAGRNFEVPVKSLLMQQTTADDVAAPWEYGARGLPIPYVLQESAKDAKTVESTQANSQGQGRADADARFVEVDGELHQVSADILKTYPEDQWERLMTCRVRFGIA